MTYDPLSEVVDEPLDIDASVLEQLRVFRSASKLQMLPGLNVDDERKRLSKILDDLIDRLLDGVVQNPTKLWVLTQFQASLALVEGEDTEARDHFGFELEQVMEILDIDSSDGLLAYYLGGI